MLWEVTAATLRHIMRGEQKGTRWSGGHGAGAGKGKAEFPESWDDQKVKFAIDAVLQKPDSVVRRGSSLQFRGVVDGVPMVVIARGRAGPPKLWTAYPEPVE